MGRNEGVYHVPIYCSCQELWPKSRRDSCSFLSKHDLVSCRNLLIYLRPEAQEKVLLIFDFALRDGGVLLLGGAETVTNCGDRFEAISKQHRIYRHIGRGWTASAGFPGATIGVDAPAALSAINRSSVVAMSCSTIAGVAGLRTTPARTPSFLMKVTVRCRCGTAAWPKAMTVLCRTVKIQDAAFLQRPCISEDKGRLASAFYCTYWSIVLAY